MGTPHPPEKALLFLALLFASKEIIDSAHPIIKEHFGDILFESPESLWSHSHYYDRELGTPVMRRFLFFSELFDASRLPEVKLETNSLENIFSRNGKRRINIDPGYITSSKVVLASAKDYSHRLYLGKGIYGEVALYYQGNRFNPMPYTYQDYREAGGLAVFEKARKELKRMTGRIRRSRDYHGVLPRQNT